MQINDHIRRKGTQQPIGILKKLDGDVAHVQWGVADGHVYEEDIDQAELETVSDTILSPAQVEERQAREKGGKIFK